MPQRAYELCTEVSPQCPVEATTYGYAPNLAADVLFLVIFAACAVVQAVAGLKYKIRGFAIAISFGSALEAVGYGGRIMLHYNAWDSNGFKIQIICIVIAPSFLAAGLYLTLKHLVNFLGPENSRLKPRLYPWIFVSCDFFSIILQAVGGGIAASNNTALIDVGNHVIVAGIAFQVATMFVCICLAADFGWRSLKSRRRKTMGDVDQGPSTRDVKGGRAWFKFSCFALAGAFMAIFIRCIYRIPEMSGGWGSPRMQDEVAFLILDSA
ncbi:uncharacterized protein LTR77_004816 [Saxophila tyrrhenica]|uniref:Uncharacterized protein n=1 Tax=Saxophila tyrrhenica TaxID=1690608 RepID=A0AAV9PAV0_9PEZI|nr:hypothetical protein LTR77_004816 [Saxophila tyrrhenica]